MRTTKELLQLTLDELNKLHKIPKAKRKFKLTGLCGFIMFYLNEELITDKEMIILSEFIDNNRPKKPIKNFYGTFDHEIGYYWPTGKWKPRKKWLEKHIKSL